MKKTKTYQRVLFTPNEIAQATGVFAGRCKAGANRKITLVVKRDQEEWDFDSESEFLAEMRRGYDYAQIHLLHEKASLIVTVWRRYHVPHSVVSVEGEDREEIEQLFELFERAKASCTLPVEATSPEISTPVVFIGHGRSIDWRDLKDHLVDKHRLKVEAYEVGARAGHTIRDFLDEMMSKSSIAFLVLSAEDECVDGKLRARENVIHELGLFQGKLGFARAIALLENNTNEFSNMHGVQQLRYAKGNIREVFGEILAVIKREFDDPETPNAER